MCLPLVSVSRKVALLLFLLATPGIGQHLPASESGSGPESRSDRHDSRILEEEEILHDGLYATLGLGVVDVEAGSGVDIPFGFTLFTSRLRTMLSVSVFDLGLLQRKDENSRFLRIYDTSTGGDFCVDSSTGRIVSYGRCSGETDVLRSMTIDLSFLPVTELYVADRLGAVHVGLGARAAKPRTLYGTLGMFFPSETGRAVAAQLSMGREYIFFGMKWGIDVRRVSGWRGS